MAGDEQDALWVLRAQCGDADALEQLLRRLAPSLRRYLAGLVGGSDADDVLQDVLILVYRKLSQLHDPALLRPWVFRIANRSAVRFLKKRRRWSEQVDESASLDDVAGSHAAAHEELNERQIAELLAEHQVSPACCAVLALHFNEEMPLAEVAAVLEIPLGTAKSRLAYGLAALRKRLKKNG